MPSVFGLQGMQHDLVKYINSKLSVELCNQERPIDKDFVIFSTVRSNKSVG